MIPHPPFMQTAWPRIIGLAFLVLGANHFVNPDPYVAIMPAYLPWHAQLVWISGLAEMLGGLGLLFNRSRVAAAWGLMALLVAVFPANIAAATHGWPGSTLPAWALWLRLPLQPLFIWWVYRTCVAAPKKS